MPDQTLEECLLRECTSRTEWDEPPALFFVVKDTTGYTLHDVGVPNLLWMLIEPPSLLRGLAHAISCPGCNAHQAVNLPDALSPPAGWVGVAFRSEGWRINLDKDKDDPATLAEKNRDAAAHRIHTRDDRIENRLISAVLTSGETAYASQDRDGEPETSADDEPAKLTGAITDSLHAIAIALLTRNTTPGDAESPADSPA